jgi:hypothetical protein
MTPHKPHTYSNIIENLGGSATAQQIYLYGTENNLLFCTYEECLQSLQNRIRSRVLDGDINGRIINTPPKPPRKNKVIKTLEEKLIAAELQRVNKLLNATDEKLKGLDAILKLRQEDVMAFLKRIDRRLNVLEEKLK